eukprot:gene30979-41240_t
MEQALADLSKTASSSRRLPAARAVSMAVCISLAPSP